MSFRIMLTVVLLLSLFPWGAAHVQAETSFDTYHNRIRERQMKLIEKEIERRKSPIPSETSFDRYRRNIRTRQRQRIQADLRKNAQENNETSFDKYRRNIRERQVQISRPQTRAIRKQAETSFEEYRRIIREKQLERIQKDLQKRLR